MAWGRQGDVVYLPRMRTQIVAARTVAEALAALALSPEPESAQPAEIAGPREEYLPDLAALLAARRGEEVKIEAVSNPADRNNSGPGCAPAGRPARRGLAQPSVKGSRVPPVSSTQMAFVTVYSCTASMPFSRPRPESPNPPNGTSGPTTR